MRAGLVVETVTPWTAVFTDAVIANQVLGFHRVTQRMVERRLISVEDSDRWLDHLAHGKSFFASVTLFVTAGRRAPRWVPARGSASGL